MHHSLRSLFVSILVPLLLQNNVQPIPDGRTDRLVTVRIKGGSQKAVVGAFSSAGEGIFIN